MVRPHRRLIRIAAILSAAVVVLGAVGLVLLVRFTDAERLRPRLEAEAAALLGREVSLGHLGWDIGWRLGIESRGGWVANAPGFGEGPLAHWERLQLGLALRPLLSRQVQVDRIDIDGLALDLQVDAGGADNWTFTPAAPSPDDKAGITPAIAIGAISLRDASVRYREAASGTDWLLADMDLSLHPQFGAGFLPHALQTVDLQARMRGGALPAGGVAVTLQAPQVQLGEEVWPLSLPRFEAGFDTVRIEGALVLVDADHASGRLSVTVPSLRGQLAALDTPLPAMRDPQVPGALQLSAQLDYSGDALQLAALDATLDGTRLTGDIHLPALAPPALRFTLEADTVDIDRYLAPEGAPGDPFELPVALLESLDARGTLRVGEAHFPGLTARDVVLTAQ